MNVLSKKGHSHFSVIFDNKKKATLNLENGSAHNEHSS
jgi:hypothetical protein